MRPKSFEEWYIEELGQLIDGRKDALAAGSVKDYAEYQNIVGVLSGLSLALATFKNLAKTQRTIDE